MSKVYYAVFFLSNGDYRVLGEFSSFISARRFAESAFKYDRNSECPLYEDFDVMFRCIDGTYYSARQ